jgi:hypothetical protein
MTFVQRILAKVGILGVLAILLTLSVLLNLWQFNRAGKADARCATRIAEMVAEVDRKTAAREVTALEIGRETDEAASNAVEVIEKETTVYVDRIRRVTVEVPASCPRALPDGVHDALSDAARAANRRL